MFPDDHTSVGEHSILTAFAEGVCSAAGGPPIVRFFIVAVSAPSLVSMLESVIVSQQFKRRTRSSLFPQQFKR